MTTGGQDSVNNAGVAGFQEQGPQASAIPLADKGPAWNRYKDIYVGRLVRRTHVDGSSEDGVVRFPLWERPDAPAETVYSVRWQLTEGLCHYTADELQGYLQDAFLDSVEDVPFEILELQRHNWYVPHKPLPTKLGRSALPSTPTRSPVPSTQKQSTQPAPDTTGRCAKRAHATAEGGKGAAQKGDEGPHAAKKAKQGSGELKTAAKAKQDTREHVEQAVKGSKAAGAQRPGKPGSKPNGAPNSSGTGSGGSGVSKAGGSQQQQEEYSDGAKWVKSWTGKYYPRHLVLKKDDVRAQDIKEDECDGEYVVDKIFDEWKVGGITYYLVKWQGYELRMGRKPASVDAWTFHAKGDWEPEDNLGRDHTAVVEWKKQKPAWYLAQGKK